MSHAQAGKPGLLSREALDFSEVESILERSRTGPLAGEEVEKLHAVVRTLAVVTEQLESKRASVQRLRYLLFGPKSEKSSRVLPASRKNGETPAGAEGSAAPGAGTTSGEGGEPPGPAAKRKGHGRNGVSAYTGAKQVEVPHPTLTAGCQCPECICGRVYPVRPSKLVRVTGMAPLQAATLCKESFRCNACGEVFTAPSPAGVGEEKYDEGAVAMVGMLRYGAGMPFNRLEGLQQDLGMPLPATTQWDLVNGGADKLEPVHEELVNQAAQGKVLHNDDTTMRVRELSALRMKADEEEEEDSGKGKKAGKERTGVFTTGIVAQTGDHQVALFMTGSRHAGENINEVLLDRKAKLPPPIQMCDAASRNVPKDFDTILGNCLAHARRYFVEEVDKFPSECEHVIGALREVYHHEKVARDQGMSDEERLRYHQVHSGPVMGHLRKWIRDKLKNKEVEPNSGLGQAMRYTLAHWRPLTLFLRMAGAPLDNNVCERALKKAILHRKNSMHYKTLNGARVGDTYMSLIHTSELNGDNPFDYLVAVMRHHREAAAAPRDWLPWTYRATLARLATTTTPVPT